MDLTPLSQGYSSMELQEEQKIYQDHENDTMVTVPGPQKEMQHALDAMTDAMEQSNNKDAREAKCGSLKDLDPEYKKPVINCSFCGILVDGLIDHCATTQNYETFCSSLGGGLDASLSKCRAFVSGVARIYHPLCPCDAFINAQSKMSVFPYLPGTSPYDKRPGSERFPKVNFNPQMEKDSICEHSLIDCNIGLAKGQNKNRVDFFKAIEPSFKVGVKIEDVAYGRDPSIGCSYCANDLVPQKSKWCLGEMRQPFCASVPRQLLMDCLVFEKTTESFMNISGLSVCSGLGFYFPYHVEELCFDSRKLNCSKQSNLRLVTNKTDGVPWTKWNRLAGPTFKPTCIDLWGEVETDDDKDQRSMLDICLDKGPIHHLKVGKGACEVSGTKVRAVVSNGASEYRSINEGFALKMDGKSGSMVKCSLVASSCDKSKCPTT